MLRPKFNIAILLALMTSFAIAALMSRHRIQVQWLETRLKAHETFEASVRRQVDLIQRRKAEYLDLSQQDHRRSNLSDAHQIKSRSEAVCENRELRVKMRNSQLLLAREEARLVDLVGDLDAR